jgi:Putative porin
MRNLRPLIFLASAVLANGTAQASMSAEERNLTELRNTVVNLLKGLVDKGVLTREQAEQMVADAQAQATAESERLAQQDKAEEGAVRVPYVPQIVRDQIRDEVKQELASQVADEVVERAQNESWGVPGALPDWARRVRLFGDIRVRGQGDTYAEDNIPNYYRDVLTVNERGGIDRAGLAAFVNTTEDRQRLRARLRFGLEAELGYNFAMGMRLATGNFRDPVSTNQTLGNTGARYNVGVDLAWLRWNAQTRAARQSLAVSAGRIVNPFNSTDLVFDQDLTFEGVASNYRYSFSRDEPFRRHAYFTLGAFPLQEVELSSNDKWLLGGQLGVDWRFLGGQRLRWGAAYYSYQNITGVRNSLDDTRLDYTAPQFVQRGNTLFDIRNPSDPNSSQDLFALASEYELADMTLQYDIPVAQRYRVSLVGDYVRNLAFDVAEVSARVGRPVEERTDGYQAELSFGSANMAENHAWRIGLGYKYLERDAVLDAFTDSDFRLGGTDVQGYIFTADYAFSPRAMARLRYLSGSEIDDAPFGVDVLQLDFNTSF